jgi:hypothetical protein
MPVIVTAAQLRSVLGVSVSLYSDSALNEYIDAAEDALGDFLSQHSVAIVEHEATDNIITVYTDIAHQFYVGQIVNVTETHGHGYSGAKTVLEVPTDFSFTFVGGNQQNPVADVIKHVVIPNGKAVGQGQGLDYYEAVPAVEKAVLALAVEIFQAILTTGGTAQALDFTPSPYRLGRTLLYKVTGLISKYLDERGMVG